MEQSEARRKFKMDEVNVTSLDEDEKTLKFTGDEEIAK